MAQTDPRFLPFFFLFFLAFFVFRSAILAFLALINASAVINASRPGTRFLLPAGEASGNAVAVWTIGALTGLTFTRDIELRSDLRVSRRWTPWAFLTWRSTWS